MVTIICAHHLAVSTAPFARVAEEIDEAAQVMRILGQVARAFDVPEWMLTGAPRPPSWRGLIKKHRRNR